MTTPVANAPSALLPAPQPGFYKNIPSEIYHRWDAMNNSRLTAIYDGTPASMRHKSLYPDAPTDAKIFGDALHNAILTPDEFDRRYAVAERCSGVTAKHEACKNQGSIERAGSWYCGIHDPVKGSPPESNRRILSQDNYSKCMRMSDAIRAHDIAAGVFAAATDFEISCVVKDPLGITRKIRLDLLCPQTIVDLKSTEDAREEAFSRSIFKFGYHRQAAFYLDTMAMLGRQIDEFMIIAYEKNEPFIPVIYMLRDDAIDHGRQELADLIALYKKCEDAQLWPGAGWHWGNAAAGIERGYQVNEISLPDWARVKRVA